VLGLIFLDDGGITLGRGHDDVGGGGRERDAAMVGMPEGEQQGRGRQRNEADKGGKPEDERMDSGRGMARASRSPLSRSSPIESKRRAFAAAERGKRSKVTRAGAAGEPTRWASEGEPGAVR
jgi:hypothetical protein